MKKILNICLLALVITLSSGCFGKDSNGLLKSPCREVPIKNEHSLVNDGESEYGY
ncbi:hypothetical protein [Arcobacter porcinus]|uniref:hypothetical protein n=1 Tax=Arcobacter porcinus TaxID=1935204 RepID=UPI00081F20C6|nr:hypothetical protein [Arcobacter porcinus]OCL81905.1 hypothetical protein AAW29_01613 [Arcobacter porcinus]